MMFNKQSERTTPRLKPKFPRLKWLNQKKESELRMWVDDEFLIHFTPCMNGKGK